MIFNSYTFVVFFLIVLALHYARLPWKIKKINLLAASYIFYAVWNPPFVILLWLSTLLDFWVGKKLHTEESTSGRKALLFVSLAGNLGMLGFFKYGTFLLENFTALLQLAGIDYQPAAPDIILPVGISFYTFQTLSYSLDMYLKRGEPEKSLLDFSLFVTFFPQLVAGPIVRPDSLLPQFKTPHAANTAQFIQGLLLLSLGLFMKVVLADTFLSGPSDTVFKAADPLLPLDAWLGVLAFSGQIFFDFAGYSTCAIGVAACLGFTITENFRYPYAAIGFSDFWRRWHITLSTWLRDYLYIPLGGNRRGEVRTYINLMLTMLLGGLWHGAAWTFVVWGALHGFYLGIERYIKSLRPKASLSVQTDEGIGIRRAVHSWRGIFWALFTFTLINITWVFFRAADFMTAWRLLKSMAFGTTEGKAVLLTTDIIAVSTIIPAMFIIHWLMRETHVLEVVRKTKWWAVSFIWAAMIFLIIISQKSSGSFIYFQF